MKRRILVLIMVTISLYSCFEKKEETKVESSNTTQTTQTVQNNVSNEPTTLYGLTSAEAQELMSKKIDPQKVSVAIKAAENGDERSILGLAKLYIDMSNKEKAKKYLKMGADKNIQSAIYNLAVLYKEEGNTAEAEKLIKRLPKEEQKNIGSNNGINPEAINAYNQGVTQIKSKNYNAAKVSIQKAYSLGMKEVDVQLGSIAKQQKNNAEALKWFKLAAARGVSPANYEVGAILFDSGKRAESIPYLTKSFNAGNKSLAYPIGIGYQSSGKLDEALKWFKIAEKNGDKSATQAIKEIENYKEPKEVGKDNLNINSDKVDTNEIKQDKKTEESAQTEKQSVNIDKIINETNNN